MLGNLEICLYKDINSTGTETEREATTEKNSNTSSIKEKETQDQEKSYQSNNINIMLGKKTKRQKEENNQSQDEPNLICIICCTKGDFNDLYKCNQCQKLFHLNCLKLMNLETKEEIMNQCQLCEILIKNDFEDVSKFCTYINGNQPKVKKDKKKTKKLKKIKILNKIQKKYTPKHTKYNNYIINSFINSSKIRLHSKDEKNKNNLSNISLLNSKVCINMKYENLEVLNKNNSFISYPFIFRIPNELLIENPTNKNKKKNIYNTFIIRNMNKLLVNNNLYNKRNTIEIELQKEIFNKFMNSAEFENILKNYQNTANNNILLRKFWKLISRNYIRHINKYTMKFPINDKELFAFPNLYNFGDEPEITNNNINLIQNIGDIYPYFNGELFTRIANIYDFITTYASKMYLHRFSIEEFYSALKLSEIYGNSEILLLSSIHISLVFLFVNELYYIKINDVYNYGDYDLLLIKIIVNYYYVNNNIKEMFLFLYYSWPELIRIIFKSRILNKNYLLFEEIDEKILNKLFNIKNNFTYNKLFTFEEKVYILEKLIQISLDSVFIRSFLKETQEKRQTVKKKQRELEEELKNIDIKKRELDKKYIAVKPEKKIEEMNKKLEKLKLSENSERHSSRYDIPQVKKKLYEDIEKYKNFIKYVNNFNENRKNIISKIDKIKDELLNININEKKYLGNDRYGNKFYYFSEQIFIKMKNTTKSNVEWRTINNEKALGKLVGSLCDKAIHENELKTKLLYLYPKYVKHLLRKPLIYTSIEDIFRKNVLYYENTKSVIKNLKYISNFTSALSNGINDYSLFFVKICNIEKGVSEYLLYDNKEWEIEENKIKIKQWLKDVRDVKKYANLIIFLNDRFKNPYRIINEKEENDYKFEENKRDELSQNSIITTTHNNINMNMNMFNNNLQNMNNIFPNNNINMNNNFNNNNNMLNNKNNLLEDLKKDINNIKTNITNPSYNPQIQNQELKYNSSSLEAFKDNKSIIKKMNNIQNNLKKNEQGEISILYSKNLFNQDGNINLYFENNKNLQSFRTRLWSKDWEPYNIEYFYIKYVNLIQSFPSLYISITILEIVLNSLVKRRDLCKKRMDMVKKKEMKEKIKKDNSVQEISEIREIREIKEPINKNINKSTTNNTNQMNNNNKPNNPNISGINTNPNQNNNNNEEIILDDNSSIHEEDYLINIVDDEVKKEEICMFCNRVGKLIKCQSCSNYTHLLCSKLKKRESIWTCPNCTNKFADRRVTRNFYNKDMNKK